MATATTDIGPGRPLTIGAVCNRLRDEFPDISISKIRYLEDQGLLAPRRTQGGYRLFSEEDVERLETILRLQRDEFLPLARHPSGAGRRSAATARAHARRRPPGPRGRGRPGDALRARRGRCGLRPGARGVRARRSRGRWTARSASPSVTSTSPPPAPGSPATGSRPGTSRRFRRWAEQRGRPARADRRPRAALAEPREAPRGAENLEKLAALSQELSNLLFWRALRGIVPRS